VFSSASLGGGVHGRGSGRRRQPAGAATVGVHGQELPLTTQMEVARRGGGRKGANLRGRDVVRQDDAGGGGGRLAVDRQGGRLMVAWWGSIRRRMRIGGGGGGGGDAKEEMGEGSSRRRTLLQ
jgi:hypothetical protein